MPDYLNPILTVDVVMLAMREQRLHVALTTRKSEPFAGLLALPGGYIHADKDTNTDDAVFRTMSTKLEFRPRHVQQVKTHAGMNRDPRGWSASVVYVVPISPSEMEQLEGSGKVQWFDVHESVRSLPELAFDHCELIAIAMAHLRTTAATSSITGYLVEPEFTITQMRECIEVLLDTQLSSANFRRKVLDLGLLQESGIISGQGRPAQGYRLAQDGVITFSRDLT